MQSRLFDNHPQGILVLRDGQVIYVNDALSHLVDVKKESLLGWKLDDLLSILSDEDRSAAEVLCKRADGQDSSKEKLHYRFIHRTLGFRHVEIITNLVQTGSGSELHMYITDVTDRVTRTEELKSSHEKLRLYKEIFERSQDAIAILDSDGRYVSQNEAHREMIGYSETYLRGRTPSIHLGEEVYHDIMHHMKEEGSFRGEVTSKTRSGRLLSVDLSSFIIEDEEGNPKCFVGMKRDISDRVLAEEFLLKSEQEKSVILHSMSDHVNYYDVDEMKIVWTNKAAADSLGLKIEDIVGEYCYNLWHGRKEPCLHCPVIQARETSVPQQEEITTPDGRVWFIKGIPVIDNDTVIGMVEVTREITEQKMILKEIKEARARAELFNDLLTHDLNNINQGIMSCIELLLVDTDLSEKCRDSLESALEQVKRGVGLIANVRKFSRVDQEPKHPVPTDIYEPLITAMKSVKSTFPDKQITFVFDILQNRFFAHADEFLFDVFYNILHNSLKHSNTTEVIIEVHAETNEQFILVSICDNGPGIPDSLKRRILSSFSEGRKTGSGLGLTLVKRILHRYGGSISFEDCVKEDYSQGSKLILELPLAET